jgi:hypothetical protein
MLYLTGFSERKGYIVVQIVTMNTALKLEELHITTGVLTEVPLVPLSH